MLVIEPEELESDATGTVESTMEIAGVDTALTATSTLVLTDCSMATGCSLITFSSALRCSFLKQEYNFQDMLLKIVFLSRARTITWMRQFA